MLNSYLFYRTTLLTETAAQLATVRGIAPGNREKTLDILEKPNFLTIRTQLPRRQVVVRPTFETSSGGRKLL